MKKMKCNNCKEVVEPIKEKMGDKDREKWTCPNYKHLILGINYPQKSNP